MSQEKPHELKTEIKSNTSKKEKKSYDPAFVAKVLAGEKAREEGEKGLRIDLKNLWE
jgi:hypothetical protein